VAPAEQTATNRDVAQVSRKADILDLAAGLFAQQGVDKTTVREIGAAAGILSGSLYHYFDSKESIVAEVITGYLGTRWDDCQRISAEITEPRARLGELLRTELRDIAVSNAAKVVNTHSRYVLQLLPAHPRTHELARNIRGVWIETIEAGIEQGTFRRDIRPEIFYALVRRTLNVAQQWVDGLSAPNHPKALTDRFGAAAVAESWVSVLLGGFESPDGDGAPAPYA
jgi:AcrR family transcriptional regulator